ncbi:MAG: hypothetical protein LBL69_03370 [Zoogloeaceae bacterium]|nr:hypothetical protein [Zoogloeaceae bacterium]
MLPENTRKIDPGGMKSHPENDFWIVFIYGADENLYYIFHPYFLHLAHKNNNGIKEIFFPYPLVSPCPAPLPSSPAGRRPSALSQITFAQIDQVTVIASEAKQSMVQVHHRFLDCFVASLLAMTGIGKILASVGWISRAAAQSDRRKKRRRSRRIFDFWRGSKAPLNADSQKCFWPVPR